MIRLALALSKDDVKRYSNVREVFLWDGTPNGSFKTKLHPSLVSLGRVPAINADFVRIAVAVFASDRTVPRSGSGADWNSRALHLTIPVSNPDEWQQRERMLAEVVNFLTGDSWNFLFTSSAIFEVPEPLLLDASKRVVLVSGGADSASGALTSAFLLGETESHSFVSHSSSGAVAGVPQEHVVEKIEGYVADKLAAHHRIYLSRIRNRLDGSRYPSEPSSRSRSLLFLALGLAVASQTKGQLWIPENGFASFNPPLGPERIGALSTRTTQPWFLWKLGQLIRDIGGHGEIENPFQKLTKGEMFIQVAAKIGKEAASHFLSSTQSCSHSDQNYYGERSGTHCGVCFGCIVRRSSFLAAELTDNTRYLNMENGKFASYVARHTILDAAKDFATTPISNATVMAMALPPGISATEVKQICERGQQEVANYLQ